MTRKECQHDEPNLDVATPTTKSDEYLNQMRTVPFPITTRLPAIRALMRYVVSRAIPPRCWKLGGTAIGNAPGQGERSENANANCIEANWPLCLQQALELIHFLSVP